MKKYIFLFILGLSAMTYAQSNFAINYIVAIPTGETEEFINETSFRGGSLEYSYAIDPQFEIGLSGSWQNYNKDFGYTTLEEGTQTLSSYRENYISNVSFYATAAYFFAPTSSDIRPFFTIGAGAMHNTIDKYVGFYVVNQQEWQFALQPQIGIRKIVDYGIGLQATARYNYGFETKDVGAYAAYSFGIGIIWMN